MQKIILIGGPSASGKTTLAKNLGRHIGLPWLSADQIHDMALAIGDREDSPETFRVRGYTPEEFYDAYTIPQVVESEVTISHETWRGVRALIDGGYEGIIEGVAVIPSLVKSLGPIKGMKVLYIANDDADEILKIARERGIWEAAHMYSDDVKKKEVEFALAYNEYLKREAQKHGYPLIDVTRSDEDMKKALTALNL